LHFLVGHLLLPAASPLSPWFVRGSGRGHRLRLAARSLLALAFAAAMGNWASRSDRRRLVHWAAILGAEAGAGYRRGSTCRSHHRPWLRSMSARYTYCRALVVLFTHWTPDDNTSYLVQLGCVLAAHLFPGGSQSYRHPGHGLAYGRQRVSDPDRGQRLDDCLACLCLQLDFAATGSPSRNFSGPLPTENGRPGQRMAIIALLFRARPHAPAYT